MNFVDEFENKNYIPKKDIFGQKFWYVNAGMLPMATFDKAVIIVSTERMNMSDLNFILFLGIKYLIHYIELYTFDQTPLLIECIEKQLKYLQLLIGKQKNARKLLNYNYITKTQLICNKLNEVKVSNHILRQMYVDQLEKLCGLFNARLIIWLKSPKLQAYLYKYGYDPYRSAAIYNSFLIPNERRYMEPIMQVDQKFLEKIETRCHCKILVTEDNMECHQALDYVTLEVTFDFYKGNYMGFLDMLTYIVKRLNPKTYFVKSLRTVLIEGSCLYNMLTNVPVKKLRFLEKTVIAGLPVTPFLDSNSVSKQLFSIVATLREEDTGMILKISEELEKEVSKNDEDFGEHDFEDNVSVRYYEKHANDNELDDLIRYTDMVNFSHNVLKYFEYKYEETKNKISRKNKKGSYIMVKKRSDEIDGATYTGLEESGTQEVDQAGDLNMESNIREKEIENNSDSESRDKPNKMKSADNENDDHENTWETENQYKGFHYGGGEIHEYPNEENNEIKYGNEEEIEMEDMANEEGGYQEEVGYQEVGNQEEVGYQEDVGNQEDVTNEEEGGNQEDGNVAESGNQDGGNQEEGNQEEGGYKDDRIQEEYKENENVENREDSEPNEVENEDENEESQNETPRDYNDENNDNEDVVNDVVDKNDNKHIKKINRKSNINKNNKTSFRKNIKKFYSSKVSKSKKSLKSSNFQKNVNNETMNNEDFYNLPLEDQFKAILSESLKDYSVPTAWVNHKLRLMLRCDTEETQEDIKYPYIYKPRTIHEKFLKFINNDKECNSKLTIPGFETPLQIPRFNQYSTADMNSISRKDWMSKQATRLLVDSYTDTKTPISSAFQLELNYTKFIEMYPAAAEYFREVGNEVFLKHFIKTNLFHETEWIHLANRKYRFNKYKTKSNSINPIVIFKNYKKSIEKKLPSRFNEVKSNIYYLLNILCQNTITVKEFDIMRQGHGIEIFLVNRVNKCHYYSPCYFGSFEKIDNLDVSITLSTSMSQITYDLFYYLLNGARTVVNFNEHIKVLHHLVRNSSDEVRNSFRILEIIKKLNHLKNELTKNMDFRDRMSIFSVIEEVNCLHMCIFQYNTSFYNIAKFKNIRVLYHSIQLESQLQSIEPFLRLPGDRRIKDIEEKCNCLIVLRTKHHQVLPIDEYVVEIFYDILTGNHFECIEMIRMTIKNNKMMPLKHHRTLVMYPNNELWILSESIWLKKLFKTKFHDHDGTESMDIIPELQLLK